MINEVQYNDPSKRAALNDHLIIMIAPGAVVAAHAILHVDHLQDQVEFHPQC